MKHRDLVLPQNLRQELKKPLGKLVSDLDELNDIFKLRYIISVGDKITESLLEKGILPDICVYDCKIKRIKIKIPEIIKNLDAKEIHIKNPGSHLTQDAFKAIDKALASEVRTKIVVDGEEDLITLVAINLAPISTLVLYGQPDQGIIVVEVNDNIKKKVEKILERMKNEN